MPEGDTLFRTAVVLRDALRGRKVTAARGRPDGAALGRVVGSKVSRVESQGKHLLVDFDNGLTLHTHLRMHGSWHRYRTGEPWRRSASRAVAVIEVPGAVAVCFDAPTVELLDSRAVAIHPALRALGPDLLAPEPDLDGVVARLGSPARAELTIAEALLDQTALAGLGNVYRSEVLWQVLVSPFAPLGSLDDATLRKLASTGAQLMRANLDRPRRVTKVYGRTGRPCPRCGTAIRSTTLGDLPRRVYWCPACQP
jgi:endonuclease-8